MKPCLIFNPAARGDKARLFRSHLAGIAHECELKPTTHAGAARELAAAAAKEGFEIVVAAGGDGTVNEVLNGISDVPEGFSRVRLGVLPLGTVNVFAKELGIPADFAGAWQVIRNGKEMKIDAPFAACNAAAADASALRGSSTFNPQPSTSSTRRYFAQMAGAGLDSRAIELADWELKKRIGPLSYVVAGFRALAGSLPDLTVSNGHDSACGKLVLIGNGKFYGGRFKIFPLADLTDGVLEVVVYPRVALEALLRGGWGVLSGNFHTGGHTIQLRGSSFEVTSSARALFHVDGENVGPLPVKFGVEPRMLRILVP